jgi:hypothetical protein
MKNEITLRAVDGEKAISIEQLEIILAGPIPDEALSVMVSINGKERSLTQWRACGYEDYLVEEEINRNLIRRIYELEVSIKKIMHGLGTVGGKVLNASPASIASSLRRKVKKKKKEADNDEQPIYVENFVKDFMTKLSEQSAEIGTQGKETSETT